MQNKKNHDLGAEQPLLAEEFFSQILGSTTYKDVQWGQNIAVGVSGGADSMTLAKLLSLSAKSLKIKNIHALIIDHGLRPEASAEALQTLQELSKWDYIKPHIIELNMGDVTTSIQEKARNARYEAFDGYCTENKVKFLFLGHHQDDQAETFLLRLSKGSGLDGLSCMKVLQPFSKNLTLVRPLLDIAKDKILDTANHYSVSWIDDPSNRNNKFTRVRIRNDYKAIRKEGLSNKKISNMTKRMACAQDALDFYLKIEQKKSLKFKDTNRVVYKYLSWLSIPQEIKVRIVYSAIQLLTSRAKNEIRLNKVEGVVHDLLHEESFRTRTLHGVKIVRDDENEELIIENEQANA